MTTVAEQFDVAIVGGGPAGLFTAKYLVDHAPELSLLIMEAGPKASYRMCPADHLRCKDCKVCTVLEGMGGGGLHSDGKLILDLDVGGFLNDYASITSTEKSAILDYIKQSLKVEKYAEPGPRLSAYHQAAIVSQFASAGFDLKLYGVLHFGTRNLERVTTDLIRDLSSPRAIGFPHLQIEEKAPVLDLRPQAEGFELVTRRGSRFARQVVLAVGKAGAPKFRPKLQALGVTSRERPVWLGVRVQVDADAARELLAISFDPKISRTEESGRRVKTHCFCRDGSLLVMKYRNAYLVGGHSRYNLVSGGAMASSKVNFNVLASSHMTQETIDEILATFARAAGPAVAVQDMGSFLRPKAPLAIIGSKLGENENAEPVDIRAILDGFGGLGASLADFIQDLARLFPGIAGDSSRLYGPALEWDFGSLDVDEHMQTSVPGLYAVGDGAGLSQGVVHAAATGIVAARHLGRRTSPLAMGGATLPDRLGMTSELPR